MTPRTPSFPGAEVAVDYGDGDTWTWLIVDGEVLPGSATLAGGISRKLDIKKTPGRNGVSLRYLGYEPARFEVMLRLWTDRHLFDWEALSPLLQPTPAAGKPKARDIQHPALAMHGIRRAFVERIGFLTPSSQVRGAFETRISFIEARPLTDDTNGDSDVTGKRNAPLPGNALDARLKSAAEREAKRVSTHGTDPT